MITTSVHLSVSGQNHEEILHKVKQALSEFFDIPYGAVLNKVNVEIKVQDQTESLDFENDEEYIAEVIAQVTNV